MSFSSEIEGVRDTGHLRFFHLRLKDREASQVISLCDDDNETKEDGV